MTNKDKKSKTITKTAHKAKAKGKTKAIVCTGNLWYGYIDADADTCGFMAESSMCFPLTHYIQHARVYTDEEKSQFLKNIATNGYAVKHCHWFPANDRAANYADKVSLAISLLNDIAKRSCLCRAIDPDFNAMQAIGEINAAAVEAMKELEK